MTEGSLGLTVQRLPRLQAALVLAQIASWRTPDRWFETRTVTDLYNAFRLPPPGNLSALMGRLRDQQLVRDNGLPAGRKRWAVTPEGDHRAQQLLGEFDYGAITAELDSVPSAIFADAAYPTLSPALAPPAWAPGITSFLDRHHPFEHNVFLMTRFPEEGPGDPLGPVIEHLRDGVTSHGLTLHIASDQQIVDDLWGNVGAHMWACRYGIGILETRAPRSAAPAPGDTLNDNVLIELGSMLTLGRRCMILKDTGAPMPPTDLTAQIFKSLDLEDLDAVAAFVGEWITNDLRLA